MMRENVRKQTFKIYLTSWKEKHANFHQELVENLLTVIGIC